MLGMDMMMKSMGLDPDALKAQIEQASTFAQEKVAAVEMQLNRIEANQLLLYQLLARSGVIETVEQYNASSNVVGLIEGKADGSRKDN